MLSLIYRSFIRRDKLSIQKCTLHSYHLSTHSCSPDLRTGSEQKTDLINGLRQRPAPPALVVSPKLCFVITRGGWQVLNQLFFCFHNSFISMRILDLMGWKCFVVFVFFPECWFWLIETSLEVRQLYELWTGTSGILSHSTFFFHGNKDLTFSIYCYGVFKALNWDID